jgi:hypothetical protein
MADERKWDRIYWLQMLEAWRQKNWRRPAEVWATATNALGPGRKETILRRSSGGTEVKEGGPSSPEHVTSMI